MPPSKSNGINALNFKKLYKESFNFMNLRLTMRAKQLNKLRNLHLSQLNDPNLPRPDIRKGDKDFKKLMDVIGRGYTVRHVAPEELIIMASETIKDEKGEWL